MQLINVYYVLFVVAKLLLSMYFMPWAQLCGSDGSMCTGTQFCQLHCLNGSYACYAPDYADQFSFQRSSMLLKRRSDRSVRPMDT